MIIFEGPDLVGKTTLAQAVVDYSVFAVEYQHYSRLSDEHDRFFDYLKDVQSRYVMDRFYMSEPVYAKVRGEETKQHPYMTVALDRECIAAGALIVVMTASEELLSKRYAEKQRDEMYGLEQILEANRLFYNIGQHGQLGEHVFHVDMHFHFTVENPVPDEHVLHEILAVHHYYIQRASFLRTTREFPTPAKEARGL